MGNLLLGSRTNEGGPRIVGLCEAKFKGGSIPAKKLPRAERWYKLRNGLPHRQHDNHHTFGKVLKQAGYATAQSGKWQLSGKVPTLVYENGFDEYCMWAYANNLPGGVVHTGGFEGGTKTSRYWHPSILKNGKKLPTTIDDFGPDIYTDFVIDFARRHKDGPFFIYYPMALTHAPYYSMPPSNPNEKEKFRHSKDKFGQLYDCGTSRNGAGYKDVTDSTDPEVLTVKKQFEEILATKPAPIIEPSAKARKRKPKNRGKAAAAE